MTLLLIYFTN